MDHLLGVLVFLAGGSSALAEPQIVHLSQNSIQWHRVNTDFSQLADPNNIDGIMYLQIEGNSPPSSSHLVDLSTGKLTTLRKESYSGSLSPNGSLIATFADEIGAPYPWTCKMGGIIVGSNAGPVLEVMDGQTGVVTQKVPRTDFSSPECIDLEDASNGTIFTSDNSGLIFIYHGYTSGNTFVYRYDLSTRSWSQKENLGQLGFISDVFALGDKVFVVGSAASGKTEIIDRESLKKIGEVVLPASDLQQFAVRRQDKNGTDILVSRSQTGTFNQPGYSVQQKINIVAPNGSARQIDLSAGFWWGMGSTAVQGSLFLVTNEPRRAGDTVGEFVNLADGSVRSVSLEIPANLSNFGGVRNHELKLSPSGMFVVSVYPDFDEHIKVLSYSLAVWTIDGKSSTIVKMAPQPKISFGDLSIVETDSALLIFDLREGQLVKVDKDQLQ